MDFEVIDDDILGSFSMSPDNNFTDKGSISLLEMSSNCSPIKSISPYKMSNSSSNSKKRKFPNNDLTTSEYSSSSSKDEIGMSISSSEHYLKKSSPKPNLDIYIMDAFKFKRKSPLKFSSTDSFNKNQQYVSYLIIIYICLHIIFLLLELLNCRK
jgi:hypothetical protein